MLYTIWWRESNEARPHSTSSGLPTVLVNPRTRSRTLEYTYDALHMRRALYCPGDRRNDSCRLSERRSERCSVTREKSGDTRPSRSAIDPVVGTMSFGCTNTGRSASLPNANRWTGLKFRSTKLPWFRLSEYVPSTLSENRLFRIGPSHCRLERRLRGAT